jgi:CubicO group peptidase (beta-lactamase class C family)
MKKQITILLVFLFFIITMVLAGNKLSFHTSICNPSSIKEKDTTNFKVSTLYLPENVGMNPKILSHIDSIVKDGIRAKAFPGCQVLVLKDGKAIYDKCFGNYTYDSLSQLVTPSTMYDLASLSKTTGTLLAIMKLYDEGKLKLTDKASMYLPFLRGTDKESITITELLFHESGLPPSLSCYDLVLEKNKKTPLDSIKDITHNVLTGTPSLRYKQNWVEKTPSVDYCSQVWDSLYVDNRFHEAAMQMIANLHLNKKTYVYSCINFIVLKEIAEAISGMPMDVFLNQEFYMPMQLNNVAYLPLRNHKKEEMAPTLKKDFLRNGVIQGSVHDPDAAFLGGVSGNAGLFATAHDVATVYQMLLNDGELNGKRYLCTETCKLFTTKTSASGRRGLGFDKPVPSNPKHSPCSPSTPSEVYGHTGYTGTCCWVDPKNKLVYVFLSNRTYPNDAENKLAKMGIRTKIQELIYQSLK